MRKYRIYILLVCLVAAVLYGLGLFGPAINISDVVSSFIPQNAILLSGAITLAAVLLSFCLSMVKGRVKGVKVFKDSLFNIVKLVAVGIVAILLSWFLSRYAGHLFVASSVLIFEAVLCAVYVLLYWNRRRKFVDGVTSAAVRKSAVIVGKVKFSFSNIYSNLLVFIVVAAVSTAFIGSNITIIIPIALSILSVILWKVIKWRGIYLLVFVTILLHCLTSAKSAFLYYFEHFEPTKYSSFVNFGVLTVFVLIACSLLVSLADIYSQNDRIE